ncbi:HmuY family protein [Ferruginibacter sp. SUN106]|uniref:HmuY family protein n=1 Tax=Ferruginibacter sp. SUN106 TaxID=2978348 RepID=UPI003D36DBA6
MKKTILATAVLGTALLFTVSSCKKDTATPQVTIIEKTDSVKVNFSSATAYTFFSFKNDAIVANSDSATTKWDFGLRFTTFILNSHTYGPGNAGAILQTGIYSNVTAAPDAGYAYDTTASQKAIKDGSWYDYNPTTHAFSPKAGQTFIFRTADNYYVKMELLAVDYEAFTGPVPQRLIYRFRYTYQSNNSKSF